MLTEIKAGVIRAEGSRVEYAQKLYAVVRLRFNSKSIILKPEQILRVCECLANIHISYEENTN